MNEEPAPAVFLPGEVAFRRAHNGFIIRGRACDLLGSESQAIVERVVQDGDGLLGDAQAAAELVWELLEGYARTKRRGGLVVRVVPHGRDEPCPRCFLDGDRHADGCTLA